MMASILEKASQRPIGAVKALASDERGISAIELALVAGALSFAGLNGLGVADYYSKTLELKTAAQMGAQAAWKTCDTSKLPATTNCTGLNAAVIAAVQSTSLGTAVTLQSGSPAEGYYCVNSTGTLVYVSNVSAKPTDCSSVSNPTGTPGDYIKVTVQYSYTPVVTGTFIAGALPTSMTASSYMRLQ